MLLQRIQWYWKSFSIIVYRLADIVSTWHFIDVGFLHAERHTWSGKFFYIRHFTYNCGMFTYLRLIFKPRKITQEIKFLISWLMITPLWHWTLLFRRIKRRGKKVKRRTCCRPLFDIIIFNKHEYIISWKRAS